MGDRSIKVTLRANVSNFKSQMAQAATAVTGVREAAARTAAGAKKSLSGMARHAEEHSAAWSTVGAGVGVFGAALLGVAGNAARVAADFDASMSIVQADTHASKAEMDKLREAAIQAGADTVYSATEAAAGIDELAKAGMSTADILSGGLSGALNLAAAGGIGVAESAETMATALVQFKLQGKDATHVADLLAAGAGKAQGGVSDMAQALKQGGLVASQMGLSIEETTGSLAAFASAGLLGSDAGTSMKTMLQRLMNPAAKAKTLMDELGLTVYNSSGKFVGMANFAGQLRDKLGSLSLEQRNAALSTIFGSDAIRAASVLYDQGAAGIQGWIDKVNDQGYAATTAAARMDNLKGDLEGLSGSWETLMIKMGSSAQTPLRSIVKFADQVVDALGNMSPGAQSALLGFTALAGGISVVGGGLLLLAPRVIAGGRALQELGVISSATAGKLKSFGVGALKLAIPATVIASLYSAGSAISTLGRSSAETMNALQKIDTNGISKLFSFDLSKYSGKELAAGLKQLAAPSVWESVNHSIESTANGLGKLFGQDWRSDVRKMRDDLALTGTALAQLSPEQASQKFQTLTSSMGLNRAQMHQMLALMPDYKNKLVELATANGLTADNTTLLEMALGRVQLSTGAAGAALDQSKTAMAGTGMAAKEAAEKIKELVDAMSDLAGLTLDLRSAQRSYAEAVSEAAAAAAKNGANLDISTAAGRANQAALDGVAKSAWQLAKSMQAAGASSDEIAAAIGRARADFIATAVSMGMTQAEAEALANSLGLIPSEVKTKIDAETASAQAKIAQVNQQAGSLGPYKIFVDMQPPDMNPLQTWRQQASSPVTTPVQADTTPANASMSSYRTQAQAPTTTTMYADNYPAVGSVNSYRAQAQAPTTTTMYADNYPAVGSVNSYRAQAQAPATTTLYANTGPASSSIGSAKAEARTGVTVPVYAGTGGFMSSIWGAISAVTVPVYAEWHAPMSLPGHATGGAIYGPGTGTSDSILARLSTGEHVWTAREVQRVGGQAAMYRLRALARAGLLTPGFREGGSPATPSMQVPAYTPTPTGGSLPVVNVYVTSENPLTGQQITAVAEDAARRVNRLAHATAGRRI